MIRENFEKDRKIEFVFSEACSRILNKMSFKQLSQDRMLQLIALGVFLAALIIFESITGFATQPPPKMTVVEAKKLCTAEGKTEGKPLFDCIKEYVKGQKPAK